jgi:hypothetical protein
MRVVKSDTLESLKVQVNRLEAKVDELLFQKEIMEKVLVYLHKANDVAYMNNAARDKQLGQLNVMVILMATGITEFLYDKFGGTAAEVGRVLQLLTGYSAEEYSRIIGKGGCDPTKLDPNSADSALEQLAKHVDGIGSKKVANQVRSLGSSR